ncbi:mechanosensitive ion channel family protein [bacterium]|jgi:small-conductance mechanosensitive channel|nr:mechanosensitive ion channel family protein [Balneola sp.]MBR9918750.1 mechanosensitive ion channel family protein [bacterium]
MQTFQDSFSQFFERALNSAPTIISGIIVLIIFIGFGLLASRGLKRLLGARATSTKKLRLVMRLTRWGFYLIGAVIALHIMGLTKAASGVLAAGGVLTVVLGFAFREIGENLLAGLFMSFSRSFDVGDLIESNGIQGIVKQINIRDVHVRTGDGIDIFIPSAIIFKNPLNNYTRDGLRRTSFNIGIDYGNEPKKALEYLMEAVKSTEGVLEDPAPAVILSNFSDNYIQIEVQFWINTFLKNSDLQQIKTKVMDASHATLRKNGFTFSSEVSTAIEMLEKES